MVGLAAAGFLVTNTSANIALAIDAASFVWVAVLVQLSVKHRPAADPRGRHPDPWR